MSVKTAKRTDLSYIRRRPKRNEVVAAPVPTNSSLKNALKLNTAPEQTNATSASPAPFERSLDAVGANVRIPKTKVLDDYFLLEDKYPVIELNQYQSGIGSIVIEGATHYAWECYADPRQFSILGNGRDVPSFANRKIIEASEGKIFIGGRHISSLRRLLISTSAHKKMKVTVNSGAKLDIDESDSTVTLMILRLGNHLELRREISDVDPSQAAREFDFNAQQIIAV